MITPLLCVKETLARLYTTTKEPDTKFWLAEAMKDLQAAVDQQEAEDRAHRDEVQALMGTYDPVRRRREKECAGS